MSEKSIMRKSHIKGDIKYLSVVKGAGGQLTKTWKMRYHDVMGRIESRKGKMEGLVFDKQTLFAEFLWQIPYKAGILTTDRVFILGRTFAIKHIRDWDEQKEHLVLALEEAKD